MPDWTSHIHCRLKPLSLDGAREEEIVEEMAEHLDDVYRERVSAGETQGQALRSALRELDRLAEELRAAPRGSIREPVAIGSGRGGNPMGGIGYDLKIAVRMIRLKPAFSAAVIGMLALGVAGNTAIFSIFDGLFLRPLPFAHPERLIDVNETAPKWNVEYASISNNDYYTWLRNNSAFEGIGAFTDQGYNLADGSGMAQRIVGARVSYNLLDVYGLKPALGRNFRPEEDRQGAGNVAMIGFGLWQRMFGGDRGVLGRVVKLNEKPVTIVGVLPKAAVIPPNAEIWTPLATNPKDGNSYYLEGVGRLKSGVTTPQAAADLLRVHKAMIQDGVKINEETAPILTPLRDRYLGDFKTATDILLGAVAVILLIACVNVAGLMMVRGEARSREIAIRTAVGASRGRVIRQLLTESLMLAVAGGVLGMSAGNVLLRGLIALMGDNVPKWIRFDLDWRFALFSIALIGAAAMLFGLAPALQTAAVDARGSLQETVRTTLSRGRRFVLSGLVVAEIALAIVLLVSSGLLLQAFRKVLSAAPGFRVEGTLTWSLRLPDAKYSKPEQQRAFYDALLDRLQTVPGVVSAAAATHVPLGGHTGTFFYAEDSPPDQQKKSPVVLSISATRGYFSTMGITFLAGRDFTEQEEAATRVGAVVANETFVKQFFPHLHDQREAIGKRIRQRGSEIVWIPIVGVTRDTKHYGLDQEMKPAVFLPFGPDPSAGMTIALHTAIDPHALTGPARDVIRQLDGDLPMYDIRTMSERLESSLWIRRAYSWLFSAFAMVAVVLAAAGIYGVIAFAVSRRTRELGIRLALGARPGQLMFAVLGSGMTLVAVGAMIGLTGSLIATGLLDKMLFGVSRHDLATYAVVVAVVALVGLAANLIPARRASRVDPMQALRSE